MPILVDGNNLLHGFPDARDRGDIRRHVLDACRGRRRRMTVVFDGAPPPGVPASELLGSVTVLYSGPVSADDVIVDRIPGGPAGRNWVVVTDDRGLALRARERGATVRSVADWRRQAPPMAERPPRTGSDRPLAAAEVADWEAFFSSRRPDDEDT